MTSYNQKSTPFVLNNYISVQVAGTYSGYGLQYLRRLLRNGNLEGIKIGQLWLVDKAAVDVCLKRVQNIADQRFGLIFPLMQIILSSPTLEIDQWGAVDRFLSEEKRGKRFFNHTCLIKDWVLGSHCGRWQAR